jgi:hypothetical protein
MLKTNVVVPHGTARTENNKEQAESWCGKLMDFMMFLGFHMGLSDNAGYQDISKWSLSWKIMSI